MRASELIGNEGQKPIDISGLVSIVNEVETLIQSVPFLFPYLFHYLHSRSLRLCISSVRFLTQSQSATVFCICTISFFCQHFKVLYLRHDLTDIDQTWSQVPVDHPIYVI